MELNFNGTNVKVFMNRFPDANPNERFGSDYEKRTVATALNRKCFYEYTTHKDDHDPKIMLTVISCELGTCRSTASQKEFAKYLLHEIQNNTNERDWYYESYKEIVKAIDDAKGFGMPKMIPVTIFMNNGRYDAEIWVGDRQCGKYIYASNRNPIKNNKVAELPIDSYLMDDGNVIVPRVSEVFLDIVPSSSQPISVYKRMMEKVREVKKIPDDKMIILPMVVYKKFEYFNNSSITKSLWCVMTGNSRQEKFVRFDEGYPKLMSFLSDDVLSHVMPGKKNYVVAFTVDSANGDITVSVNGVFAGTIAKLNKDSNESNE